MDELNLTFSLNQEMDLDLDLNLNLGMSVGPTKGLTESEDFECPSSNEAEANSSDCGLDLDMSDLPDANFPYETQADEPYLDGEAHDAGDTHLEGIFDLFNPSAQGCSNNPELEETIKSDTAVAGICGFANFANTCYMNSGLQCLIATPTVVKYFTEYYPFRPDVRPPHLRGQRTDEAPSKDNVARHVYLSDQFGPLLQNVWTGEYRQLKPVDFKDTLSDSHPQFKGTQQHDCQEFLALLLDTLHEELRMANSHKMGAQSECGTSMELHTAHSTEKSAPLSLGWLSRHSSFDNGSADAKKAPAAESIPDELESRGSPAGSPKSFDSHSSVEDKVTSTIRNCPIPKEVKSGKFASNDDEFMDDDTMDSIGGSSSASTQPTSNLIAPDNLKRMNVVRFVDEGMKSSVNNLTPTLGKGPCQPKSNAAVHLSDYMKESKTLNVNVLAEDEDEMNNEISFDSEKFARHDKQRLRETIDNLNTIEPSDIEISSHKPSNTKRHKTTNMNSDANSDICSTGACSSSDDGSHSFSAENSCDFNEIKRIRLDSMEKEKNIQFEKERLQKEGSESCSSQNSTSVSLDPARLKEAIEADRFWEKYLASNDTVVARTFQGQFKNTVVCSACNFVSVSFEPFMYLPVPLPNGHILQFEVTFVGNRPSQTPTSLLFNLSPADTVMTIKEKVALEMNLPTFTTKLYFLEVYEHHVSRVVDDWTFVRYLKDDHQIYVVQSLGVDDNDTKSCDTQEQLFSMSEAKAANASEVSSSCDILSSPSESCNVIGCAENPEQVPIAIELHSCVICMEDFPPTEMRQHNACDCVMCAQCLERTIEHHQTEFDLEDPASSAAFADGQIKCPGCRQEADPASEFITLDMVGISKPRVRTFTLFVLHRAIFQTCESKQKPQVVPFGHPTLVQVSNCVTGASLYKLLESINFLHGKLLEIVLVSQNGKSCSRCLFADHCTGCIKLDPLDDKKEVILQPTDAICLSFAGDSICQNDIDRANQTEHHESMKEPRLKEVLDLDDCLAAFSEKEVLDESNPWYCSMCKKHQCATKTLSIWRFPDFLIIYLKRFVYVNSSAGSVKLKKRVNFQVNNLDLTKFLSGPLQADSRPVFSLYGCVCHFGSVSGGHYTAYSRHLVTGLWNYYDDNIISDNKVPGENLGDNTSAYILFYQRNGSHTDTDFQTLSRQCRAYALQSNGHPDQPRDDVSSSFPLLTALSKGGALNHTEDEEDEMNPDLSSIIRSLDSPPPS